MARLERGWVKDEFSAPRSIWKTALDQKCKIIYLYLVDQLEEGGDPSHAEIARACSCSERTSERATDILHELGLIEKIKRPIPGKKANDTNLYIIHHPDQVDGLPWLEAKKGKGKVATQSRQVEVATQSRQEVATQSRQEVATQSRQGSDTESVNSQSVESVSQSVISLSPEEIVNDYFKKAFDRGLNEVQMDELMSFGLSVDELKKQIRKVSIYVDIRKSPFAAVVRAVAAAAEGKEWTWNELAGEIKPNKGKTAPRSGRRQSNDEKLPRAVAQAMEREARGEKVSGGEVDPETEARLRAKLDRMRGRLAQRQQKQEM